MPESEYFSFVPEIAMQVQTRAAAVGVILGQLEDYELAHLTLDTIGVPRELTPGGGVLSLANRVVYLNGMLVSAKRVLEKQGQGQGQNGERTVVYKIQKGGRGVR
jgi:hypothetical protein